MRFDAVLSGEATLSRILIVRVELGIHMKFHELSKLALLLSSFHWTRQQFDNVDKC